MRGAHCIPPLMSHSDSDLGVFVLGCATIVSGEKSPDRGGANLKDIGPQHYQERGSSTTDNQSLLFAALFLSSMLTDFVVALCTVHWFLFSQWHTFFKVFGLGAPKRLITGSGYGLPALLENYSTRFALDPKQNFNLGNTGVIFVRTFESDSKPLSDDSDSSHDSPL